MSSGAVRRNKGEWKDNAVRELNEMFGSVLHIDIIQSVAASCNYDTHSSASLLLKLTNNIEEQSSAKKNKNKNNKKPTPSPNKIPKPIIKPNLPAAKLIVSKKTSEIERVIHNIVQGYKVLVLLRGLPGSGKSYLAKQILFESVGPLGEHNMHILSTDDYFMRNSQYVYDPTKLQDAHGFNHNRAFTAMSQGRSPVIIDNTNTQMWEMKPYAMMATDYGYVIEILEPDTWWFFNVKELARNNGHGVPKHKIKEMCERYEKNITTQKLLLAYSLKYKFQKPPQFRSYPPLLHINHINVNSRESNVESMKYEGVDQIANSNDIFGLNRQVACDSTTPTTEFEMVNLMDFNENIPDNSSSNQSEKERNDLGSSKLSNPLDEILMLNNLDSSSILKPDQIDNKEHKDFTKYLSTVENAWGVSEKALECWDIVVPNNKRIDSLSNPTSTSKESPIETKDSGSNTEEKDFQYLRVNATLPNDMKVIQGENRNINMFVADNLPKPRKKHMIDTSCLTEDVQEMIDMECNSQTPITSLMDLFPNIPKVYLEDLYEKCKGSFSWTVELLLENNCDDLVELKEPIPTVENREITHEETEETPKKSIKNQVKSKKITPESVELKRCLESKIDINKLHYSDHLLKVKQYKFGVTETMEEQPQPSTSTKIENDSSEDNLSSDDNSDFDSEDNENGSDSNNEMIELSFSDIAILQLESRFGDTNIDHPKGFLPVVQVPVSLARQLYSLYIESVYQQMENQNEILNTLIKEDEEFARKLQAQEEEKLSINKNDETSFREIVDEQKAISLHQKDTEKWRNVTANDLAVKLTRLKLFSIFPTIDRNILTEILHAHDNDYNKTVEVLVASAGPENVNGSQNSINEPPLCEATLREMQEAEVIDADFKDDDERKPATFYREEANKRLRKREELYQKAQSYYQRGMTEVAIFYSELAQKETHLYEKANSLAAASFIDEHSRRIQDFDTLDLHYLYVKEAVEALDIFIDRNINLLQNKKSAHSQKLFIITGRGKRSDNGISRIKPKVMSRLKKRNIPFFQLNPGLLQIRITKNTSMSCDL